MNNLNDSKSVEVVESNMKNTEELFQKSVDIVKLGNKLMETFPLLTSYMEELIRSVGITTETGIGAIEIKSALAQFNQTVTRIKNTHEQIMSILEEPNEGIHGEDGQTNSDSESIKLKFTKVAELVGNLLVRCTNIMLIVDKLLNRWELEAVNREKGGKTLVKLKDGVNDTKKIISQVKEAMKDCNSDGDEKNMDDGSMTRPIENKILIDSEPSLDECTRTESVENQIKMEPEPRYMNTCDTKPKRKDDSDNDKTSSGCRCC